MSLQNRLRIIRRVDAIVIELMKKYPETTSAFSELTKLDKSLNQLITYLAHIDRLDPDYTTNEIDKYMVAITLDMDILKTELHQADYIKLHKNIRLIKTIMKFHPTRYSFLEFIVIWIYELIYFI